MKETYIKKIYAGWLGKIIGIRMGAPVEGWTYEKIQKVYGELDGYPVEYSRFAADDDSNGPMFFLRAVENKKKAEDLTAQDVAEALLNYAPFEHGFFWWGGYGISTEHTAYLNLRKGIPAPQSGSILQNGSTVAEQIGGQIFIDTWGLAAPGKPELAARLAKEAASVTHDGNGIYGGMYVAACISAAFIKQDIQEIIETGLSHIPSDCQYARTIKAVMDYYNRKKEKGWRHCFRYISDYFGYDKYPGNCHIIPNGAVMALAMLYGKGNFARTLNICNMCGWDTDCNTGNVGTILGVKNGLEGIPANLRYPIHDFLAYSSVMGSLNLSDLPTDALYIARTACELSGESLPDFWGYLAEQRPDSCHFEFPGSTHALEGKIIDGEGKRSKVKIVALKNTQEKAHTGKRSLKICAEPVASGSKIYLYKRTYCTPEDFDDSRYDPAFSPQVYPGQILYGSVYLPSPMPKLLVYLYGKDLSTNRLYTGKPQIVQSGEWMDLTYSIPRISGGLISEIGVCFEFPSDSSCKGEHFTAYLDDLYTGGDANYSIVFSREKEEIWEGLHREIRQFTRLNGLAYLEDGQLHLSCADFGAVYTGRHDWKDYQAVFTLTPIAGKNHYAAVRVQGAIRAYAVGLLPGNKAGILKNSNGWKILKKIDFPWEDGKEYQIKIKTKVNQISAVLNDGKEISYTDEDSPYLTGAIGLEVEQGSHMKCRIIEVS